MVKKLDVIKIYKIAESDNTVKSKTFPRILSSSWKPPDRLCMNRGAWFRRELNE